MERAPEAPGNSMRSHLVILLVAATLVVPLPAAFGQADSPTTTFDDQNSGGRHVVVASVTLTEDGFVAIHDATLLQGEVFASVIGVSQRLDAGTHADVKVYLTRELAGANETVIAMPHKDTNDNGIYDFVSSQGAQDGPFIGGPNAIPESFFEANAPALAGKGLGGISAVPKVVNNTAFIQASAQNTSGVSVLIDTVELSAPGYVAVHDATLVTGADASGINGNNVLTSVIGVSDLLPAGHHHNILVQVGNNCDGCKTNGTTNGTLVPMVHKETGGNATRYDFVSSGGTEDGPFTGQPGAPLTAVIAIVETTYSDVATQTFPAQATGGNIVIFPELFVPQGGYAAVHDETLLVGNVLGSVVGVSPFLAPGLHKNVSVELNFNGSGGLNASQTVVGMLHKETNNNTSYDFVSSQGAQDGPYTGGPSSLSEEQLPAALQGQGLGGVNAVPAAVNLSATVRIAAHQASDGSSIRIDYADFAQSGFVALHDASLLANVSGNVLSSVVGVSEAQTGLKRNFTIELPGTNCAGCVKGALNASQLLIAMPHADSDGDGRYTFITSGGKADGPIVTDAAVSNSVSALGLNIVVATGEAVVPIREASANGTGNGTGNATTPATPTGSTGGNATPSTPTGATPATPANATPASPTAASPPRATPAESTDDEGDNDVPGFGIVAVLAAIGIGLLVMRRRQQS